MKKQHLSYLAAVAVLVSAFAASADPFTIKVAVGPQSPASINAGGTAVYTVTLTKTNTSGITANMTVTGLPAGATASFSPNPVMFGSHDMTRTCTLTITTTTALADGTYPFTVVSQDGGSHNFCSGPGTLVVGNGGPVQAQTPFILSISLMPDNTPTIVVTGTPGVPYELQATPDLSTYSWTTIATKTTDANGLFSYNDLDSPNYVNRFYRAAKTQ